MIHITSDDQSGTFSPPRIKPISLALICMPRFTERPCISAFADTKLSATCSFPHSARSCLAFCFAAKHARRERKIESMPLAALHFDRDLAQIRQLAKKHPTDPARIASIDDEQEHQGYSSRVGLPKRQHPGRRHGAHVRTAVLTTSRGHPTDARPASDFNRGELRRW
jgi:hypothetical protein